MKKISLHRLTATLITVSMIMSSMPALVLADDDPETVPDEVAEETVQEEQQEEEKAPIAEEPEEAEGAEEAASVEAPEPEAEKTEAEKPAASKPSEEKTEETGSATIRTYNAPDNAAVTVSTWTELQDAIQDTDSDPVYLKLGSDINSPGGTSFSDFLLIPYLKDVTIDLDGHTINRNLTTEVYNGYLFYVAGNLTVNNGTLTGAHNSMGSESDMGGCIFNANGTITLNDVIIEGNSSTNSAGSAKGGAVYNCKGTLTVNGGTIRNNTADDGGAIYNTAEGTVNLNGVTITGNEAKKHGGGAIDSYGPVNLKDTTVTGNSCTRAGSGNNGGGIWIGGTSGALNIEGKVIIRDNTSNGGANNLFLKTGKFINVTGDPDPDSKIMVTCEECLGKIAANWDDAYDLGIIGMENGLDLKLYDGGDVGVKAVYIDRQWNSTTHEVVRIPTTLNVIPSRLNSNPGSGWYYVYDSLSISSRVSIKSGASVNIILGPNADLKCTYGIYVPGDATLNIYGTGDRVGKLTATAEEDDAGIGGNEETSVGKINIYGGKITATGGKFAAGIGGGYNSSSMGNITIYEGEVTASSPVNGAGIGGGYDETVTSGSVTIRGGKIEATGGTEATLRSGAGIGAGAGANLGENIKITISGGSVIAKSGGLGEADGGAGIGGGAYSYGGGDMAGKILIEGGTVYADGSGHQVHDSEASSNSYRGGAGIGAGFGGNITPTGTITITGGNVITTGNYGGAALGAGAEMTDFLSMAPGGECEGKITIDGGRVQMKAGKNAQFIGHGYAGSEEGTLKLGEVCVHLNGGSNKSWIQRADTCRSSSGDIVIIEDCSHDIEYMNLSQVTHTASCKYCSYCETEPHSFDSTQHCTVCGFDYIGPIVFVTVHYESTGPGTTYNVAQYSIFQLPEYDHDAPEGKVFRTWRVVIHNGSGGVQEEFECGPNETFHANGDTAIFPVYDSYSRLEGYSLSLEGDIGVLFYMSMSDDLAADSSTRVRFTLPDGTTGEVPVSEAVPKTVGDNSYYAFKCNVSAKQMTSPITAQLISGGYKGEEYTFTVRDYASYLLAHTGDVAEYDEAAPLVRAMLNYGAYSQVYFGVKTDDLANSVLDASERTPGDVSPDDIDIADPVSTLTDGVTFEGASLSLKSETTLSLYFKSNDELTFSCSGYAVEKEDNGVYQIARIRGISAGDISKRFALTVTIGTDGAGSLIYSPLNYCKTVIGGDYSDKLKDAVKAFYTYSVEADKYF